MAGPRGRGLRPGGVLRAVGRLVLLVAIGFGLGLLFGVVTEEPELLAAHLRGDSESVELEANAARRGERAVPSVSTGLRVAVPSVGAGRGDKDIDQSAAVEARPLVDPEEAKASERLSKVSAAQPSLRDRSSGMEPLPVRQTSLQALSGRQLVTGELGRPDSALAQTQGARRWSIQVGAFSEEVSANRLAEDLRARYPVAILPAGKEFGRWRVRIQPIEDEGRAREMAGQLKRDERLPTWVTPMEGREGS